MLTLVRVPDLRAKLAAVITPQQQHPHLGPGPHGYGDPSHHLSSASPHDHNIDPAIGGHGMMGGSSAGGDGGSGDDDMGDGRKSGKRELSQSKRAAQNRAAQVRNLFVLQSKVDICPS